MAKAQTQQLQPLRKENDLMKTTLKKIIGGTTLGLALLANSVPTWAGSTYRQEVVFSSIDGRDYTQGSMVAVRYSKDKQQYINCVISSGGTQATCSAKNRTGAGRGCSTLSPDMIAVVSAITDSSLITFVTAPGSGQCSEIDVNNGSYNLK
jgi:hypothetical protein